MRCPCSTFETRIYNRTSTVEHWTTILDLAHKWVFPNVKELALKSLEALAIPLVNRIALYQKYNAPDCILNPHYATLCARSEMPTLEETTILGGPTSIMIFSVRERILSSQGGVQPLDKIDARMFQQSVSSYFNAQKKKKDESTKESTSGIAFHCSIMVCSTHSYLAEGDKAKSDARVNGRTREPEVLANVELRRIISSFVRTQKMYNNSWNCQNVRNI